MPSSMPINSSNSTDNSSILANNSMPSPSCVRCNAYLKKIAAVIIGIFVYTLLGIPVGTLMLLSVPWMSCKMYLTIQSTSTQKEHYKPRAQWDLTDYMVALCWGLSFPFALPINGLVDSGIAEKVLDPILLYPKKLWTEANEQLQGM